MLPKAAEAAKREIEAALAGDSRASLKARVIPRDAYEGKIRLVPEEHGRAGRPLESADRQRPCSGEVLPDLVRFGARVRG